MIRGIGIDTVEIDRFLHWHSFSSAQLQRIFSIAEIAYCLANEKQTASRFAVRFAAREAFFKALQAAYPETIIPFLTICRSLSIERNSRGLPEFTVDWERISMACPPINPLITHLSLSHSRIIATALVIVEQK